MPSRSPATAKTDCGGAPQCGCGLTVNGDVGHRNKHRTRAVTTLPEQINIKYDINTILLWNQSVAACVCVCVCVQREGGWGMK